VSRATKGLIAVRVLWLMGVGFLLGVVVASRIETAVPPRDEPPTSFSCYEEDLVSHPSQSGKTVYKYREPTKFFRL
jgi:hypothetical protein